MSEEPKQVYPYLVTNNKAKLTIYNGKSVFMEMFLPTREEAEKTVMEIGQRFGKVPIHTIENC